MFELPDVTRQEAAVHKKLLERGYENRLNEPIEIPGYAPGEFVTYYPAIYLPTYCVDVEIDGSQHESDEHQRLHDLKRTDLMEASGIHVIRFSNREVDNDLLRVRDSIISFCNSRRLGERTVEVCVEGLTFGNAKRFGVRYTLSCRDPRRTKLDRHIDTLTVGRGNNCLQRSVFDIILPDAFACFTKLEKIRFLETAARRERMSWIGGRIGEPTSVACPTITLILQPRPPVSMCPHL